MAEMEDYRDLLKDLQTRVSEADAKLIRETLSKHDKQVKSSDTVEEATKDLSAQQKLDLIKANLQEITHAEILDDIVLKQNRPLKVYWGTATTGRPHVAYFIPVIKLAQFLRAGCRVKILLADVHGFLDNLKAPIELVNYRAQFYKFVVQALLKVVGVNVDKLEFVLGSSYQDSKAYVWDLLRLSAVTTEHDAKRAGAEVVKQTDNAPLSGLIYPLMQALDEVHLDVDAQFGGVDQRKIFAYAQDSLGKIGYTERAHLMNPMLPGLTGTKMSASDPNSKIDVLDDAKTVEKKIKKAVAVPKEPDGNGLIAFVEHVLMSINALKDPEGKAKMVFETDAEAEPLVYTDIQTLREDYRADKLTPQILKRGIITALNEVLAPIQAEYEASKEWQEIALKAYPPEAPAKKEKKKKDKGSRHPGGVKAQEDGSVEGPDKAEVEVGTSAVEVEKTLDEAAKNLAINGGS